ncbi:hypothetical protein EW145_g8630, partial [Phellinidium pouzarii]
STTASSRANSTSTHIITIPMHRRTLPTVRTYTTLPRPRPPPHSHSHQHQPHSAQNTNTAVTVDFSTNPDKLWWDTILNQYSTSPEDAETEIIRDLTFLFHSSIHWLSFLNENHFFRRLLDRSEREYLQPSLVLSALALATLLQSSERGLGQRGRVRALMWRDAAQAYLESAWNASAVDPSLAQAAMVSPPSSLSLLFHPASS